MWEVDLVGVLKDPSFKSGHQEQIRKICKIAQWQPVKAISYSS